MADKNKTAMEELGKSYDVFEKDLAAALQTFPFAVRIPMVCEILYVFAREAFKPEGEGALMMLLDVEKADFADDEAPPESVLLGGGDELKSVAEDASLGLDPHLKAGMTDGQRQTLQSFLNRISEMAVHFGPSFGSGKGGIQIASMGIITMYCRSIGPFWLEGISAMTLSYFHESHGVAAVEKMMEEAGQPLSRQQKRALERDMRKGRER
jgi:hypothetical protein